MSQRSGVLPRGAALLKEGRHALHALGPAGGAGEVLGGAVEQGLELARARAGGREHQALGVAERPERLRFGGILLTMYEAGNPATERVVHYVREHLPQHLVFDMPIPRTPATADAFAAGQPVVLRAPADAASQAYVNLATRLAERFT